MSDKISTKLEKQQSKRIEHIEKALTEKTQALTKSKQSLQGIKQSLQQEQALNKKNARYKIKNEELLMQIKELES